jgi:hypothetical protein
MVHTVLQTQASTLSAHHLLSGSPQELGKWIKFDKLGWKHFVAVKIYQKQDLADLSITTLQRDCSLLIETGNVFTRLCFTVSTIPAQLIFMIQKGQGTNLPFNVAAKYFVNFFYCTSSPLWPCNVIRDPSGLLIIASVISIMKNFCSSVCQVHAIWTCTGPHHSSHFAHWSY